VALVRSDLGLKSDEDEEIEPPEALFYYPKEYVIETWRQNQRFGTFPDGTYNSLDPQLRADWHVMTARYNYHFEQLKPVGGENGEGRGSGRKRDLLTSLINEASAPPSDVSSMFGD
jgi:hypothetical protein